MRRSTRRVRSSLSFSLSFIGQCEIEGGSFAFPPFRPDLAAVPVDHPGHGREADAAAREFLDVMEPLEGAEELPAIVRIESRAVVSDDEGRTFRCRNLGELDLRRRPLIREFPGIAQQVLEHGAEQRGIAEGLKSRVDAQVEVAFRFSNP